MRPFQSHEKVGIGSAQALQHVHNSFSCGESEVFAPSFIRWAGISGTFPASVDIEFVIHSQWN
jgi:hypothetical protein